LTDRPNGGGEGGAVSGHGFGTAPVFLASVSTILGAVMFLRFGYAVGHTGLLGALLIILLGHAVFLRFGYAVGHTGLLGALLIILLGHAVTVPTALAIAEIATNRRVEGGGESRSRST
jgi:hypothetical protein